MNTKNGNVGVIGAGNMGSTLAEFFNVAGFTVTIANSKGPHSLREFTERTGIPAATVEEVVKNKAIVVMALPMNSIAQLPTNLFAESKHGTIVIDTCNYFPQIRDEQIAAIDEGLPDSQWVSQQLGVNVVKAFNNITALSLGTGALPAGSAGRICLSVAGDSSAHKITILKLMDTFGFDGADAGALSQSWRQQPGAPAYCRDLNKQAMLQAIEEAVHNKQTEYRANVIEGAKRAIAAAGSLAAAVAKTGRPARLTFNTSKHEPI